MQSLAKAQSCLEIYRTACAKVDRPADWILRRYAWLGADGKQVREEVLPAYVGGLMEHWRESVEDDAEKELFARIDAGENVTAEEIAADRLLWAHRRMSSARWNATGRPPGPTTSMPPLVPGSLPTPGRRHWESSLSCAT